MIILLWNPLRMVLLLISGMFVISRPENVWKYFGAEV